MIQREMADGTYVSYDEETEHAGVNGSGITISDGITEQADMELRWRPTEMALNQAKALLVAAPLADYVVIPMTQPGKTNGLWKIGQEVCTVPGALFLASKKDRYVTIPGYSWARNEALTVAERFLGDAPGTVAYATVSRDGSWAVFEY